jgi:uncharacterized protein (TIGR03083 family)
VDVCKAGSVTIPVEPPSEFPPLFRAERARLLDVLGALTASDWIRPTPCPGWSVVGLAAHLLGGDFSLLARQRDGHRGTRAPADPDEAEFIGWLDELQIEWVHAARRLSPRLVTDLLSWTDSQIAESITSQNPSAVTAQVSWASNGSVPVWLDQARELSERWLHRQQILQALDRPSDLRGDLAEPVLDGLRWAYPFRLLAHRRPAGSVIEITVTGPEVRLTWNLVSEDATWRYCQGGSGQQVVAQLQATTEQAWRLLSNNLDPAVHGHVVTAGDAEIVETLMRTRAIIGTPK